jgi:S1-C subfamily serine protease
MRTLVQWLAGFCATVMSAECAFARAAGTADSVVKVFCQMRLPNPVRPWIKQNLIEVGGSAVVIEGNRVLTSARIVVYADEIFVQGGMGGDSVEAMVVAIGPAIDLAVLSVEDKSFFDKRPPIGRGSKLPEITSRVQVQGFPIGGNSLATTQGTVARIEYDAYETGALGLRIQVDAAINPGNSGGPAIVDGRMIGLILGGTENIGLIIPNQEIEEFLADVADGRYDGKPHIFEQFQRLENETLRGKLGLAKDVRGLLVRESNDRNPSYPLKEFDILTRIGPHAIDNEGMIQAPENLRLSFLSQVPKLARNGSVVVSVWRDGKAVELKLPVSREPDRVVRTYDGHYQSYFVCGPLVFSSVTSEAVSFYMCSSQAVGRNSPLTARYADRTHFPGEELVVVTAPMLRTRMAKGYADPFGQVLSEVNGTKVKNHAHLVELIRSSTIGL